MKNLRLKALQVLKPLSMIDIHNGILDIYGYLIRNSVYLHQLNLFSELTSSQISPSD